MKKLSNKIFWILFIILTLFLIVVLFIFNYNNYSETYRRVEKSLTIMNDQNDIAPDNYKENVDSPPIEREDIRFADVTVYTVLINSDEVKGIISHNESSNDEDKVKTFAQEIIRNKNKTIYIGNLYFENYSYSFFGNNIITIVDNFSVNNNLIHSLITSMFLFVLLEGVILFIALKLTKWITIPVEDSFNKQKQFIADASHELKTPLAVIMASSEAFERDNNKKWIKNIQSESERMNKLILSLLDLAKSENNNKEYFSVNLSKLIEKSILTYESLIYEKKIKLTYNIDKNINFVCNEDEIKQLMSILIDNAIKHSDSNGEIDITLKNFKNEIVINVKNKGVAIARDDEEKIFERFYKVDESRNRDSNRYGLGLAIAKNIVTNHKGTISAHSESGYTNFKIIFKK